MTTLPPEPPAPGPPAPAAAGATHVHREVAEGFGAEAGRYDRARPGGTEVEVARFEDWDPAGRAFDAVVAAQAWHWVDPVAGAAKAAAALRPGGRLAVLWNAFDPPPGLRAAFTALFQRVMPGSPGGNYWARPALDAYRVMGGRAADGIRAAGAFGEPQE